GAAGGLHALSQRFARTEHAYRGVAGADARFGGEILDRNAVHLDPSNRGGVFGLERFGDARHAAADRAAELRRRLHLGLELARQRLERARRAAAPPVVIDHGIPERAIKPRDRALFADLARALDPAHERLLQDVF